MKKIIIVIMFVLLAQFSTAENKMKNCIDIQKKAYQTMEMRQFGYSKTKIYKKMQRVTQTRKQNKINIYLINEAFKTPLITKKHLKLITIKTFSKKALSACYKP